LIRISLEYRPLVRLFISHAETDLEIARALRLRLEEIPDLSCFVLADDVAPGSDWELLIRRASDECDAIACVVTPEYIKRPWFYAEWAAFWFQEKAWFLLMCRGASLDELFEVMRRRHVADLDDRHSVERLFRELAIGRSPLRALDQLAAETVRSVAEAQARVARRRIEEHLDELATLMHPGQSNISEGLVDSLIEAGQFDAIVRIARDPRSAGVVKRRQLASFLVSRGYAATASRFDDLISNHAERRTVGWACLARLAESPSDADALRLTETIYRAVREPQRRELRQRARDLEIQIGWPVVDAHIA
jgi:hypothetical protein